MPLNFLKFEEYTTCSNYISEQCHIIFFLHVLSFKERVIVLIYYIYSNCPLSVLEV